MEAARAALVIGIDDYDNHPGLRGCVNDAAALQDRLESHHGGAANFTCTALRSDTGRVTRVGLRREARRLFAKQGLDVALFYFAGHGAVVAHGACIVTQDGEGGDEGVPMAELVALANGSDARERVIVLDCCSAGAIDQLFTSGSALPLAKGVSIIAACRDVEEAEEEGGRGLFTETICAALDGGAADVRGHVTITSIYAYVDQIFSATQQRPVFKANVEKLVVLRRAAGALDDEDLRHGLLEYFPDPHYEFPLDPSYEPTEEPHDDAHEAVFAKLQKFRAARLVEPIGVEHMYFAALERRSCLLTPLGRFYWKLAKRRGF